MTCNIKSISTDNMKHIMGLNMYTKIKNGLFILL